MKFFPLVNHILVGDISAKQIHKHIKLRRVIGITKKTLQEGTGSRGKVDGYNNFTYC